MRKNLKNRFQRFSISLFKIILGVLLGFIGAVFTVAFLREISSFTIGTKESYFLLGIAGYALIHFLFKKPILFYIFGHELTHAISVFLCRGRVRAFHISSSGGRVRSTKSNFFISLSPYLFPIYTIFVVVFYFILALFLDVTRYLGFFLFFLGFTWAFHIFLTFYFLGQGQKDIVHSGRIFSLPLIYIVNLLILVVILSCLSKQITFSDFIERTSQIVRSMI